MSKVSIIILNYNGLQFNKNCLDSLLAQSYKNFEIIFVNNHSTDWSYEEVKKIYDKQIKEKIIKVVEPKENLGFAWGNNYGVTHSDPSSEYICLLNNDTIVPQDWLENLVKGIQSDKKLGAVGSVIYDQGFEKQMDQFLFDEQKKGLNNYFFDSVTVDQTQEDKEGNIIYTTGLSGCCLLYKKSLLEQPFDEMYFAYMEDTALCVKILLQGYRVGMVKDSRIQHFGSGSFGKKPSVSKSFHGMKNYILNFILLSQGYFWIAVLPFFVLGIITRTLISHPVVRIRWLWKALSRIIHNRKTIGKHKKKISKSIPNGELYSQLSKKFMYIPFYTPVNLIIKIIANGLNAISSGYFSLIWILRKYDKKN
jgi:GT2 family glycosyltransferase